MVRLSDRYTREQPEERMRSFMERRLLRRVGHENQSTNDESEIPSVSSTGYGWWNAIAVLEILGGAIGLVVGTLYPLLNSAFNASPAIVALDILFLLSIIAGVYLWRNREFGLHLSLFLFVLQIPQFALGGISFQFISGISITSMLHFTSRGMGVELAPLLGPGGEFIIQSAYKPELIFIGINIYAVVVSYMLAARLVGQIHSRPLAPSQLSM